MSVPASLHQCVCQYFVWAHLLYYFTLFVCTLPVMVNSSRDVPCVATADVPQAVQKTHPTVDEQPREADDVLSKLKRVEAQLNALEATAYNMQREIKLDSYKVHCVVVSDVCVCVLSTHCDTMSLVRMYFNPYL